MCSLVHVFVHDAYNGIGSYEPKEVSIVGLELCNYGVVI